MHRFIVVFVVIMIVVGVASAQGSKSPTVSLAVSGMKCEDCAAKVDKALRGVDGVKDVTVNLKNQTAQIVLASASVKSDVLIKAVKDAGFQAKVGKGSAATKKADCCCSGSDCKKDSVAAKKSGCCCSGSDCKKDSVAAKKAGCCCSGSDCKKDGATMKKDANCCKDSMKVGK